MTSPSARLPLVAVFATFWLACTLASAAWAADGRSLKSTAKQFVAAGFSGDVAAAKKLALTFEQLSAMATVQFDKAKYERELDEYVTGLKQTGALPELRIDEVEYFPAAGSSKRKKDIVLAVVKPVFADADLTERWQTLRGPFYFIQTDQGWRLSIKK
jgi:hypothetical protein